MLEFNSTVVVSAWLASLARWGDCAHAAATWFGSLWSNGFPSTSMRCRITASLRASATFAFAMPMRLASCMAQDLSAEAFTGRVRMMCAA